MCHSQSASDWFTFLKHGKRTVLRSESAVAVHGLYSGQASMQQLQITVLELEHYLDFVRPGTYLSVVLLLLFCVVLFLMYQAMKQLGAFCPWTEHGNEVHPEAEADLQENLVNPIEAEPEVLNDM